MAAEIGVSGMGHSRSKEAERLQKEGMGPVPHTSMPSRETKPGTMRGGDDPSHR